MFKHLFKPTSIFEDLFTSPTKCLSISNHVYNKVLHKLGFTLDSIIPSCEAFDDFTVYHIADDRLSSLMYLATKEDIEAPDDFKDLKFITIEKQKKVAFVIDKHHRYYVDYKQHRRDVFERIIALSDSFSKYLLSNSSGENTAYIDHIALCHLYINEDYELIPALFKSICLEPVTSSSSDLEAIIEDILTFFNCDDSLRTIREAALASSNGSYYNRIKKGYCIPNQVFKGSVPLALYANILNYVFDNSCVTCLKDLFNYKERYVEFSKEAIIFNQDMFLNSLTYKCDTEDFNIYTDYDGNTFAKLKDTACLPKLKEVITSLSDNGLLEHAYILYSEQSDVYLLFEKALSLKDYIHSIANKEDVFLKLLKITFSDLSSCDYLKKLHFNNGANLIDCFSFFETHNNICFTNLSNLSIGSLPSSQAFDYYYVIMLIIREYITCSSICIDEIYGCEFAKVLHPVLMRSLITFLETGKYEFKQKGIKNVISDVDSHLIKFVETLPCDDSITLSKLSFFNGVEIPKDLEAALEKQHKLDESNGFLSLDSCLNYITSNSLNSKNFKNIFLNSDLDRNCFLTPEAVIISKDICRDGNYQIIGVLWNHYHLRSAAQVIKAKILNCQEVYVYISKVLSSSLNNNSFINHKTDVSSNLYIDTSNKAIFNANAVYYHGSRNLPSYYYDIIGLLNSCAKFSENYDVFDFFDIVPLTTRPPNQLEQFYINACGITKCDIHNHWRLPGALCKVCAKSSEIVDADILDYSFTLLYQDEVATFCYDDDGEYDSVIYKFLSKNTSNYIKQVRLGIENDLFSKFTGLVPLKVLVYKQDDSKKLIPFGIKYDGLNFSNIISISTFKQIQRLKVILVMYKKLLSYILDGSFICSNKKIFETMVMHKDFKGEMLIPNLPLMDCKSVISNNDSLKESKIENTKKVFASFLKDYIMADEFLSGKIADNDEVFMAIVKDIERLNFSEDAIRKCLNLYNNYCLTHSLPFSRQDKLCPMCISNGIKEDIVLFEDKSYFEDLEAKGSEFDGGEADIYTYSSGVAQKIFKSHVDSQFKARILGKALEKEPLIRQFNDEHNDIKIISVNEVVYMKEGSVLELKGYFQDFIEGSYKISNLKDKSFVKEHNYSRKDVVEILIKVCQGIEFLHSIGGFIGDLNGGNILIKEKSVYIIDIDGMSFDDVKNCVYTNMYIYPPSAENNNITKQDDWYSLAVQAFYYLTYSHPFRGICDNSTVPENETKRMELGLSVLGPHNIIPPSISIGWDFIPQNLLKHFLDTFESGKRESMLEELQTYSKDLSRVETMFTEIERNRNVAFNINEFTYIDSDSNLIYKEKEIANINNVLSVIASDNSMLLKAQSHTYHFNTVTEKLSKVSKTYPNCPISLCGDNVYYTSQDQRILMVDELDTGASHIISRPSTNPIISLFAAEKDKIIFVETASSFYNIYCNSKLIHSIGLDFFTESPTIRILYDEVSQKWLVIFITNSSATGVVIEKQTERISTFEFHEALSSSISFYSNMLYYVDNQKIHYYNIVTGNLKSMICPYVKKDSNISRYDNKFIVLNPTTAYSYVKS